MKLAFSRQIFEKVSSVIKIRQLGAELLHWDIFIRTFSFALLSNTSFFDLCHYWIQRQILCMCEFTLTLTLSLTLTHSLSLSLTHSLSHTHTHIHTHTHTHIYIYGTAVFVLKRSFQILPSRIFFNTSLPPDRRNMVPKTKKTLKFITIRVYDTQNIPVTSPETCTCHNSQLSIRNVTKLTWHQFKRLSSW
jgi:hypothetical protein